MDGIFGVRGAMGDVLSLVKTGDLDADLGVNAILYIAIVNEIFDPYTFKKLI
jgi:hypothetical protein